MGLLTLDKSQYKAYRGQQLLDIDQNEFDILWVLSTRPDRVFSEEDIAIKLKEEYYDFKEFSIRQSIDELQQKLSLQNIRLMTDKGFKIEFREAFR